MSYGVLQILSFSSCFVKYPKVVLFVSGKGADENQYKPDRDESQWWARRDALVRAVAAFLFGPSPQPGETRELVLVFDEDFCCIHMTLDDAQSSAGTSASNQNLFPSERTVISLWKEAASSLGRNGTVTVSRGGLKCTIHNAHKKKSPNDTVTGMESKSKREIMELIYNNCTLDFLRNQGLNCSISVALRKVNRKTMINIWHMWQKEQAEVNTRPKDAGGNPLVQIIDNLLISTGTDDTKGGRSVVAGILHESGESELPVWGLKEQSNNIDVCFFLGAVRDMSKAEKTCLLKVCQTRKVPVVKVRLGPVAEFTSKILTVVAFHQSFGVLGASIQKLMERNKQTLGSTSRKRQRSDSEEDTVTETTDPPILHVVLLVPSNSSALTSDLKSRNRVLWCLVRCTVATLWRSRLVGSSATRSLPLKVSMTFCFQDDFCLTLDQDKLVRCMAEQHQAAPSEYQILHSLDQFINRCDQSTNSNLKTQLNQALDAVKGDSHKRVCFALNFVGGNDCEASNGANIADYFYAQTREEFGRKSSYKQAYAGLLFMSVIQSSLLQNRPSCQDHEAATITMIQHFAYQDRLQGLMHNSSNETKDL